MQEQELNTGIIFTRSNCIGCNKCISSCIVVGGNVVVKDPESDRNVVLVDQNKCILCGNCIKECVHHARSYRDDTDAFFSALEAGENISILVSPTLLTDYEAQYHNIIGYLKHLGVKHIFNIGFGGDLMVWVYMNFIQKYGLPGVISQVCPVVVTYLEKYKPELLEYLMPVQTPMMCTAIYVSDYLGIKDKLAYIGPCIAAKHEIDDTNTYGAVSYNVTFERLMKRIEGVDIAQYRAEDEASFGLGALIPMAGGLSDNIERYIGFDQVLIQNNGSMNMAPYFEHYNEVVNNGGKLPFLVEALSCTYGCNFGTGTDCGVEMRNEMTFSAHQVKENAYKNGMESGAKNYIERLALLNRRFEDSFELSSFVRQYDCTKKVCRQEISEEELEMAFQSMYQFNEEQRHTDCGACGYTTCRDMAYAIGIHANTRDNCIGYAKECIRLETEKTNQLLEEISHMNDELKKSTQLKSNFLANMSHEIRTPMNAIIGMAEMALRGDIPHEEKSYIQQIKSSGRSLLAIINDILDFSKIESGKMEINETEYQVTSIINDTVNIVMTRIGEKEITLLVDADPTIPYSMYGDDIRIKQVLVNFANNAVKFTDSGFVEISLKYERCEDGIYIMVCIEDSGIGIKEEDMEKLFNSFQQVDSTRNRNVEGTGLGLVISKEFVSLMNGEIHVDSVYGKGSKFSFRIPQQIVEDIPSVVVRQEGTVKIASLISDPYVKRGYGKAISYFDIENTECTSLEELKQAQADGAEFLFLDYANWNTEAEAFARIHTESQMVVIVDSRRDLVLAPHVRKLNQPVYSLSIAAVLNREVANYFDRSCQAEEFRFEAPDAKVLIVDDNAINLTVAKGLLTPLHMDIRCAPGALEAIEMLKSMRFDIVFMDHMMPDIDGVEATHRIRAMEEDYCRNVPIIALSANAINNAREMFLSEGMNDFVAKPVEMSDISAKIRRWLPEEKIRNLAEGCVAEAEQRPLELQIEGLDVAAGVALAGTLELYRAILTDYYDVIAKKADLIEKYEREESIEAYTIEVHALKSASRLIGASELSDQAAWLEKCGHEKEWGPIHAETASLLERYQAYLPILEPYCCRTEQRQEVHLETEQIAERLNTLAERLDDFDLDGAKEIMEELECCPLEGAHLAQRERLSEAVADMEYDDAAEIAAEWRAALLSEVG